MTDRTGPAVDSDAARARAARWSLFGGALCGALVMAVPCVADGTPAAIAVFCPFAAVVGAIAGLIVGLTTAWALDSAQPATENRVRAVATAVSAAMTTVLTTLALLLVPPWGNAGAVALGALTIALGAGAGALLGPRVMPRPSEHRH